MRMVRIRILSYVCKCNALADGWRRRSRERRRDGVTKRHQWAMGGAALLALVLGGAAPALSEDGPYVLTIKNHRFEPTEIAIPANQKIKLTVKNLDPTPEEFESTDLRREKVVAGGGEITVYIGPLQPGRYEFFGDFNPTTARGHIVVK